MRLHTRTLIRLILLTLIACTIPFWIFAFWTIAQRNAVASMFSTPTTQTPTETPLGAGVTFTPTPSLTPTVFRTPTEERPLQPTPFQFIPPTAVPATSTPLPTQPPAPTDPPEPTEPPAPTDPPPPTATPLPPPSDTPQVLD